MTATITAARNALAQRSIFMVELPMDAITPEAGVILGALQGNGFSLSGAIIEILRQVGENHKERQAQPAHQ